MCAKGFRFLTFNLACTRNLLRVYESFFLSHSDV